MTKNSTANNILFAMGEQSTGHNAIVLSGAYTGGLFSFPFEIVMPVNDYFEDQSWFWTKEWQQCRSHGYINRQWQDGEKEVEEDLKNGRYKEFTNPKDYLTYLDTLG